MQKLLSLLGVTLAILMLLPDHAYARGGGGGGGGRGGGRQNQQEDTPKATPTPTPAPAPVPVQGVITAVTPFAISLNNGPQTVILTFKVGRDTTITLTGKTVTIADLKPGMTATIKPAADRVYADSIVATVPVAATPTPAPVADSGPAPRPYVPPAPAAQGPTGPTPPPFGQKFVP
jgi:hypothetical protein